MDPPRSTHPRPPLPPGPYLVLGLARSGQAAASLLAGRGETVIGVDAGRPEGAGGLRALGVEVILDADGLEPLARAGSVVKSPGVPREAPAVAAALERGLPVIGELELAWRLIPNRFCAVTGTNGKTTVTELLGHVWRTAGEPVAVAGNVGTPLASLAGELDPQATVVCEVSSFQLEDAEDFAPECGVLLNIAPDHLDRHRTLDAYLSAKLRLFANQGPDDVCVYNGAEPAFRDAYLGRGRRVAFCREPGESPDCEVLSAEVERLGLALRGAHNASNAAAAYAAATAMGIPVAAVADALRTFAGVPHRLERVRELGGVVFVNDSKATNVAAAAAALEAFAGGVHAILGGSLKGGRFEGLAEPLAKRAVAAYLIGDAAERLERDLASAWERGVEHHRFPGLAEALAAAAAAATEGEIVLLAPACASFDAYRDFEERGEHFRRLVQELP